MNAVWRLGLRLWFVEAIVCLSIVVGSGRYVDGGCVGFGIGSDGR